MAELKDILEEYDFSLHLKASVNLGTNLSRAEIEQTIIENSYPLPSNSVTFIIEDGKATPHFFRVTYLKDSDTYVYLKQKVAG